MQADPPGAVILWEMNVATLLYHVCSSAGRNMTKTEWKRFFPDQPYRITCPSVTAEEADELALAGQEACAEKNVRAPGRRGSVRREATEPIKDERPESRVFA